MKSLAYKFTIPAVLFCFLFGTHFASALTISPVKVEVTGDPGQTLRGDLELLNEQTYTKTFFSSFENFEPSGDTGSPKFTGAEDGLATWLATEASVPVETGATVKVPYTITIPTNAEPGGYFAAIFWGEQDPAASQGGQVAIGGKLGVLILLRVSGDIADSAGISDFKLVNDTFFHTNLPLSFSYRFKNDGGDRVVPLGDIVVTNIFGGNSATISANENEGSVLPNSARKFVVNWDTDINADGLTSGFFAHAKSQLKDFHFGLYKASLSVVYGATNQTATDSFRFVMIPWQFLTVAFGALVILLFMLKQYNKWIISKSKTST